MIISLLFFLLALVPVDHLGFGESTLVLARFSGKF